MKSIKLKFDDLRVNIWQQVDTGVIEEDDAMEQIDQLDAAEKVETIKFLEGEVSKAKAEMMRAKKPEEVIAAYNQKVAAEKVLSDFLISSKSPAEQKAFEAWAEAAEKSEAAAKVTADLLAELIKFRPELAKKERKVGEPSGKAPKDVTAPRTARIIELAKAGKTNKEIGIELGYTKEQGFGNGTISPIAKHYR